MNFQFDRKKFYDAVRRDLKNQFSLTQPRVDGLNYLLDSIELDPHLTRIEEAAYMLSTTGHETAWTFKPIHEYGSKAYFIRRYGGQTRKGQELGNDTADEGFYYRGTGDVQLTGESNFEKAEDALRKYYKAVVEDFERRTGKVFDLTVGDQPNDTGDPNNATDPAIAYAIMSYGMRTGMFTGLGFNSAKFKGLTGVARYKAWRKIINGTDHDDEIAASAVKWEKVLRAALLPTSATTPATTEPHIDSLQNLGETPQTVADDFSAKAPVDIHVPASKGGMFVGEAGEASIPSSAEGTSGAPPNVEVKAATPSWTSRISSGLAYLTGLGISVGTFLQGKLEQITINHVIVIAILVGVGYAIHHFSSKRAQERTKIYIANALNPDTPNLKVT